MSKIWVRQVCGVCSFRAPAWLDTSLGALVCTACGDMTASAIRTKPMSFEDYQERLDNYWGGL